CGHNAQLTHVLGVARALVENDFAGNVVFMAVPAEEYVDLEWRTEQAKVGRLEFLGGKAELLRLGAFDDVDMAILVHATGNHEDRLMGDGFKRNALELVDEGGWAQAGPIAASTDAGDLSHVMPMLHPSHGGCSGTNHAADFLVSDHYVAYVQPAKAVAHTIVD